MKTFTSRFLKSGIALLLIVLMLLSSTISGLAAVVDTAQTGWGTGSYWAVLQNFSDDWSNGKKCMTSGSHRYFVYYLKYGDTGLDNNELRFRFRADSEYIGPSSKAVDAVNSPGTGTTNAGDNYWFVKLSNNQKWQRVIVIAEAGGNWYWAYRYDLTDLSATCKASATTITKGGSVKLTGSCTGDFTSYYEDNGAGGRKATYIYEYQKSGTTTWTEIGKKSLTGSGVSAESTGVTFTPASAGTYNVRVKVKDDNVLANDNARTERIDESSNLTITVKDKYTVSFNNNGHGGTAPASQTVVEGQKATQPTAPTEAGWTFGGWYTSSACTGSAFDFNTAITADTELFAKWTQNPYTVTVQKGTGCSSVTPSSASVNPGESVSISSSGNTGYHFVNWTTTSGSGTFADANSQNTTFTPTSDATVKANYAINTYNVSVTEAGGVTGTVKLNGTATKNTTVNHNGTVTLSVTPPTNYKIASITGGGFSVSDRDSFSGTSSAITEDTTITVTYARAGSCVPSFAKGDASLVIGGTYTNVATTNEYCTGGTISYTSSKTTVATVNSSGVVTAVAPGTATITAACSADNTTATYKVTVLAPSIAFDNSATVQLKIGESINNRSVVVENAPVTGSAEYSYQSSDPSVVTVSGNTAKPTITAKAAGNATITATYKRAGQTVTATLPVTVLKPAIDKETLGSVTMEIGEEKSLGTVSATNMPTGASIVVESTGNEVVVDNNDGTYKIVATGATTTDVTIKAYVEYNGNVISDEVTLATVTVNAPTVTVEGDGTGDKKADVFGGSPINLTATTSSNVGTFKWEIIEGSQYISFNGATNGKTVKINTVAVDSDVTAKVRFTQTFPEYSPSTQAVLSDLAPTGAAQAPLTQDFTINVLADTITVYFSDSKYWGDVSIYAYVDGGSITKHDAMVKIGTNDGGESIYAYKLDRTVGYTHIIFHKYYNNKPEEWPSNNNEKSENIALDAENNGYYLTNDKVQSSDEHNGKWKSGKYKPNIVKPAFSLADVNLNVGATATVNATDNTTCGKFAWKTADTGVATVTGDTSTVTVEGKAVGTTTLTATAYAKTKTEDTNATLKTVATTTEAAEFVAASKTVNVTVNNIDLTVNATAASFIDGTTLDSSIATVAIGSATGPTATEATVGYKSDIYLSAALSTSAQPNYRFKGWYVGDKLVTDKAVDTVKGGVTENTTFVAKYAPLHTLRVDETNANGITVDVKENNNLVEIASDGTVKIEANATVTVTATVPEAVKLESLETSLTGGSLSDNTLSFIMSDNATVTVVGTPLYKAEASVATNKSTTDHTGGSVTIEGADKGTDLFAENSTITYRAEATTGYTFDGWYKVDDTTFSEPLPTGADKTVYTPKQTTSGTNVVAHFHKNYYIDGTFAGGWKGINSATDWPQLEYHLDKNNYTYSGDFAEDKSEFIISKQNKVYDKIDNATQTATGITFDKSTDGNYRLSTLQSPNYKNPVTITFANSGATYTINATAAKSDAYSVSVEKNGTTEKIDDYFVGQTVELTIAPDAKKYLENVTVKTDPQTDLTVEIVDPDAGKVKFTMPKSHVTLTPVFADKYTVTFDQAYGIRIPDTKADGYKTGENVTLTVTPIDGTIINDFTYTPADFAPTETKDEKTGAYTLTFAMPSYNVTITPDVDAVLKVAYVLDGETPGGTVKMYTGTGENRVEVKNEGYITAGEAITYVATPATGYSFKGYYVDSAHTRLRSPAAVNAEYTFKPEASLKLFPVFAKDYYICGTATVNGDYESFTPLDYDAEHDLYYHKTSNILPSNGTKKWFQLTDKQSWNDDTLWDQLSIATDKNVGVTMSIDKASFNNAVFESITDGYGTPATIYFDANAKKFYAVADQLGATVTLSSGPLDWDYKTSTTNVCDKHHMAMSEFVEGQIDTAAGESVSADKYAYTDGTYGASDPNKTPRERYTIAKLKTKRTITVKTTIEPGHVSGVTIDAFVIYNKDGSSRAVMSDDTANFHNLGNGVYTADIQITDNCYITPVYRRSESFLAANPEVKPYKVYFDTTTLDPKWGRFKAIYAYGQTQSSETKETILFNGEWPGQLLVPTDDPNLYYGIVDTKIVNGANVLDGVVFNNYAEKSVPALDKEVQASLDIDGDNIVKMQTYDYREPLALTSNDYNTLTFETKVNRNDGYHGQIPSKVNEPADQRNPIWVVEGTEKKTLPNCLDTTTDRNFNFQVLEDHYDKPMGLDLQPVTSAEIGFYIVAEGDVKYGSGDGKKQYEYDKTYTGDYSVDWHVYDSTGKYITTVLSSALYGTNADAHGFTGLMAEIREQRPEYDTVASFNNKLVMVAYEDSNACANDWIRIDGQWTGIKEASMTADVHVGLFDGTDYTDSGSNTTAYGSALADGAASTTVDYKDGRVSLTAERLDPNYIFLGWYTLDEDGVYNQISTDLSHTATISKNTTYYAMFQQASEEMLTVNLSTYKNFDDPEQLSNNGTAELTVTIYKKTTDDKGNKIETIVAEGPVSTVSTTASVMGKTGDVFKIVLTSTPKNEGKFQAWYELDENGKYSNITEDQSQFNSTSKVEYVIDDYVFSNTSKKVLNIYSDVTRVARIADLIYYYNDRFGNRIKYTERDVELTEEECAGFIGNGNEPLVPSYITTYVWTKTDAENIYETDMSVDHSADGYELSDTLNTVMKYAPVSASVFDDKLTWSITGKNYTAEKSRFILEGVQSKPSYKLSYTYDDVSDTIVGEYNTLARVTAPDTNKAGDKFSYWERIDNGKHVIMTYSTYFAYKVTEDMTINAVYQGEVTEKKWNASIESVTQSREISDNGDYVYTDYLVGFAHPDHLVLRDEIAKGETTTYEYGLVLVTDMTKNKAAKTAGKPTADSYAVVTPEIEEKVKTVASSGSQKVDNLRYYQYNLTDKVELTNKNRFDYYLRYNNNDTKNLYKYWSFVAYAYIKVGNEVIISDPQKVQIFDTANKPITG